MTVVHLGKALCGHDGIIHGGLLATLLDEVLALVVSNKGKQELGGFFAHSLFVGHSCPPQLYWIYSQFEH
jgi:hypothetical protein